MSGDLEQRRAVLKIAFDRVMDFSVAIDGGANRGDWTEDLAQRFRHVMAFEPASDMADHLRVRFANSMTASVHQVALWDDNAAVTVCDHPDRKPGKTRSRFVQLGGAAEAMAIDALNLHACGLIKLDIEGAEVLALKGAARTLAKFRPVLIVECKDRLLRRFNSGAAGLLNFLHHSGAREIAAIEPDRIFAWPK